MRLFYILLFSLGLRNAALASDESEVTSKFGRFGDPRLLIWTKGADLSIYRAYSYDGDIEPSEGSIASGAIFHNLVLIAPVGSNILWGMPLRHCYRVSNRLGFIRIFNSARALSGSINRKGSEYDIAFLQKGAGRLNLVQSVDSYMETSILDYRGYMFLGAVGVHNFYWNPRIPEKLILRGERMEDDRFADIRNLDLPEGVLDGENGGEIELVGYFRNPRESLLLTNSVRHLDRLNISLREFRP